MATEVIPVQPAYSPPRQWPRYKLDVPVRVIVRPRERVMIVPGRGSELNGGGLAVFVGLELAIGTHVVVEFTPPYSGEPIRVRCIVRDRNGYTYGLVFLLENEEDGQNVNQIRSVLAGLGSRQDR